MCLELDFPAVGAVILGGGGLGGGTFFLILCIKLFTSFYLDVNYIQLSKIFLHQVFQMQNWKLLI